MYVSQVYADVRTHLCAWGYYVQIYINVNKPYTYPTHVLDLM